MKNFLSKHIVLFMFILVVFIFGYPVLKWNQQSGRPLKVYLLNKTVPDISYREHKGFGWILKHFKYTSPDGEEFNYNEDYYGFHPDHGEHGIIDLPNCISDADLIYIADTYGVYTDDLSKGKSLDKPSKIIYGGLKLEEISKIREALYKNGSTLVAEFNTFGSPTSEKARREISNILGVDWTGWIGRYYLELDKNNEIPVWAVQNYENQYETEWEFEGAGFVFVHESGGIIVLREGVETGATGCRIRFTESGATEFGIESLVNYNYWFDLVEARGSVEILAEFQLDLLEEGEQILINAGIPSVFPAIAKNKNDIYTSYYFTGDFNDIETLPEYYKFYGYDLIRKWVSITTTRSNDAFYWKVYVPVMKSVLKEVEVDNREEYQPEYSMVSEVKMNARLNSTNFEIFHDGKWEEVLIKGVNIGMGKPGHYPGEASITKGEYKRWLKQIGEMNANAIRVYTINPPAFYEAFYEYNRESEEPIYLFHGIWVNEEDYLTLPNLFDEQFMSEIKEEIERIVNLIHGNAEIEDRKGHASGSYRYDISEYVIGWIFGIEWEPRTVVRTNEINKTMMDQKMLFLETGNARPFEIWLATLMDYVIAYEYDSYQWQRPISFTNWLTTDLLDHPSEPYPDEDLVSVDPNLIIATEKYEPGLFASYHVYPYYPDFMSFDENYQEYVDFRGEKNSYAGYLNDLRSAHYMPIVVAEFGLPSSRGVGRITPSGMDQGLHTEESQGNKAAMLFGDIIAENYAGGLLFIWQDEWFKRSWNVMEFDNPYRRAYWSNVQTFEEQYGLLGFETDVSKRIKIDGKPDGWKTGELFMKEGSQPIRKNYEDGYDEARDLEAIYVSNDEKFLYLGIEYKNLLDQTVWEKMNTTILFDTISNQGIVNTPEVNHLNSSDFVIQIKGENDTKMLVDSYYDMNHYLYGYKNNVIKSNSYASEKYNNQLNLIKFMVRGKIFIPSQNRYVAAEVYDAGRFRHGNSDYDDVEFDSLTDFNIDYETNMIELRVPWLMLNFKDPSKKEIMGDFWEGGLESRQNIDGIKIGILTYNPSDMNNELKEIVDYLPERHSEKNQDSIQSMYTWNDWDAVETTERLKKSYYIFKELYGEYE